MSWVYEVATGRLYSDSGELFGVGYSGNVYHKNEVDAISLHDQGPIPIGFYSVGEPRETAQHGPFAMPLTPDPGNEMFGRSDFLIHGDSVNSPGTASEGCVIMSRDVREAIWNSGDHQLKVVSGEEQSA